MRGIALEPRAAAVANGEEAFGRAVAELSDAGHDVLGLAQGVTLLRMVQPSGATK